MDILATSVWLRSLELSGEVFVFPSNGYRGDYVIPIAKTLLKVYGNTLHRSATEVFQAIPPDETSPGVGDKEAHIDALIVRCKSLLGTTAYEAVHHLATQAILEDIREDLAEFGVTFDRWFSEKSLLVEGAHQKAQEALKKSGTTYEKEGALWFRSTALGDEKDRVIVRSNGQNTYFFDRCQLPF